MIVLIEYNKYPYGYFDSQISITDTKNVLNKISETIFLYLVFIVIVRIHGTILVGYSCSVKN